MTVFEKALAHRLEKQSNLNLRATGSNSQSWLGKWCLHFKQLLPLQPQTASYVRNVCDMLILLALWFNLKLLDETSAFLTFVFLFFQQSGKSKYCYRTIFTILCQLEMANNLGTFVFFSGFCLRPLLLVHGRISKGQVCRLILFVITELAVSFVCTLRALWVILQTYLLTGCFLISWTICGAAERGRLCGGIIEGRSFSEWHIVYSCSRVFRVWVLPEEEEEVSFLFCSQTGRMHFF